MLLSMKTIAEWLGDLFTLQYFMGHSNIKTTRRYISFLEQDREHAHKIASPVKNWKL